MHLATLMVHCRRTYRKGSESTIESSARYSHSDLVDGEQRLGKITKKTLRSGSTRPVVSAVSIWEMAIKAALGWLEMADPPELWVSRSEQEWGARSLPVTFDHAIAVRSLPLRHNDTFDRMLVAQALCEQLTHITVDRVLDAYDVPMIDARL